MAINEACQADQIKDICAEIAEMAAGKFSEVMGREVSTQEALGIIQMRIVCDNKRSGEEKQGHVYFLLGGESGQDRIRNRRQGASCTSSAHVASRIVDNPLFCRDTE